MNRGSGRIAGQKIRSGSISATRQYRDVDIDDDDDDDDGAWCWLSPCRVVSSALKCFHDLTEKIESGHCGTDGAAEYRRSYIQPVVDQSRDTVTAKCTLLPPYDRDYASSRATTRPRRSLIGLSTDVVLPLLSTAVYVLTVARHWRASDLLRTTS